VAGGSDKRAGEFARLGDLLGAQPSSASHGPPTVRGGLPTPGTTATPGSRVPATNSTDLAARLTIAWPQVVGEEVAANSRPVRLRQGRLVVAVSSTMWAQTLQFMELTIATGLNDRLDMPLIEHIAFRHAGWQETPGGRSAASEDRLARGATTAPTAPAGDNPASLPELTPTQEAALRSVEELGLEPHLVEKITGAMRAAFVREQQASVRS
jgi:hypothetical protein